MWLDIIIVYAVWAVSIGTHIAYVHRCVMHRQCEFHPALVNFAKIVTWCMRRYDIRWQHLWVAEHAIHHRYSDTLKDVHTPKYDRLWWLLFVVRRWITDEEVDYYTRGYDIPVTKLDHILAKYPYGRQTMFVAFVLLFGWTGFFCWVALVLTFPALALYNYIAHVFPGYVNNPNKTVEDTARNVPYMVLFYPGEELHGNHHAYPSRCNFAVRWWEVDIVYCILKALTWVGLVKIRPMTKLTHFDTRYAPPCKFEYERIHDSTINIE